MLARIALTDLLSRIPWGPESDKASAIEAASPTLSASSVGNHRPCDICDFRPPSEIRAEERKGEVVGPSRFAEEQTSIDEPADEFRDGGRGDEGLSDRLQIHSSVLSGYCDEHSLLRRSRNLEPIVEEREVEFM